jgi:hypothetical protein
MGDSWMIRSDWLISVKGRYQLIKRVSSLTSSVLPNALSLSHPRAILTRTDLLEQYLADQLVHLNYIHSFRQPSRNLVITMRGPRPNITWYLFNLLRLVAVVFMVWALVAQFVALAR